MILSREILWGAICLKIQVLGAETLFGVDVILGAELYFEVDGVLFCLEQNFNLESIFHLEPMLKL